MTGIESDEPKKPSALTAFEEFVLAGTDMKPLIPSVKWRHMIAAHMALSARLEDIPIERHGSPFVGDSFGRN